MKKLFTFLTMLVLGIGSMWATAPYSVTLGNQVTDLSNLSADKCYILKNSSTGKYNCYDESNNAMNVTTDLNYSCVVKLSYNNGNMTIKQVCTETYYQNLSDGAVVTLGTSAVNYAVTSSGSNFLLTNNNLKLNTNNTGNLPKGANNTWTGGFSQWIIYEVTLSLESGYTVINYSKSTGSYTATNSQGTWASKWESTATDPQVILSTTANNIKVEDGSIWSGGGCTYTIKAQDGYVITGYSITGVAGETMTLKSVEKGTEVSFTKNVSKTLSVSGLCLPITTFTQSSPNKGIVLSNFTIYVKSLASVDELTDLSNNKKYILTNKRGTWAVGNDASDVNSTVELNLGFSDDDWKQQFAIIKYDDPEDDDNDGYYLYSVSAGKFVYKNGTKLSLTPVLGKSPSKITFVASTHDTYKGSYPVVMTVDGSYFGVHTGHSPDIYAYQYANDEGNATAVLEVGSFDPTDALAALPDLLNPTHTLSFIVKDGNDNTLFTSDAESAPLGTTITTLPSEYHRDYFYTYGEITPVTITGESAAHTDVEFIATPKTGILQYTADATSPIYYNLNIRSKYLAYNDEATGDVELLTTSTPFNPNAAWAFIGDPYTGFKIINQTNGTDKYLTYTSVVPGSNHGNNNIKFVTAGDFTNQYWYVEANTGGICLRMKENTNIYFHHDSGNNFLRTCSKTEWSAVHNDEGSTLIFASDEAVLQNLYNDLKDVYFADGVGKYTWNGSGTAEEARANINGAGLALEMHATSSYKDLYDALLDIKANITLNSVPAGFYRIKGNTSGKYLAAGLASNSKFNMTDATDATTIFYYDGTKLTNLSSGMCNGVTGSGDWNWVVGTSASNVSFLDGHTSCGYGIQTATAYFYDNGDNSSSADRGTDVNMTSGDVRYRSWNLTEITEIPVTLKAAALGYATFCCPVPVKIPSGVEAYVSRIKDNTISLFKIENFKDAEDDVVIPANTAVMLHNNGDVSEDLTVLFEISNYSGEGVTDNGFYGTIAAESMVENDSYYSLRVWKVDDQATKVGFAAKAAGGTLAGFKGWIWQTGTTARNFTIVVDGESDPTGIVEALGLQEDNVDIYDLNGRKLSSYKKGINIVNGKKVMVQ